MKKHHRFLLFLLLLSQVLISGRSFAQSSGKWTDWSTASCFQGISVSVVNMGHSMSAGGYLWGIRLRNDYSQPITFRYRLSIGEKNTSQEGGDAVWKLKPGEIWTDGNDKFTAKLYESSSSEYNYYIWNVCFGEAKCGSDCYAKCDATKGKENQPCGVDNPSTANKSKPPVTANTNKPTTSGGKPVSATAFNKAELVSECRKVAAVRCKLAETESKIYELEEAGKPTDNLYKEAEKLCKEVFDFKFLFLPEKYAGKNGALQLWDKILQEEIKKCPYSYDGICTVFE